MAVGQQLALLGVPFDEFSSFLRGCAAAPPAIRAALWSDSSNPASELGPELEGAVVDLGDAALPAGEAAIAEIFSAARSVCARGLPGIFLGGDHSITFP